MCLRPTLPKLVSGEAALATSQAMDVPPEEPFSILGALRSPPRTAGTCGGRPFGGVVAAPGRLWGGARAGARTGRRAA